MAEDQPDVFEFNNWCEKYELTEATKDVLLGKGFNSYKTLAKLDADKIKAFFGNKLLPAQAMMLQEGVELLNPPAQSPSAPQQNPRNRDTSPRAGTSRDNQDSTDSPQGANPQDVATSLLQGKGLLADQVLELLRSNPAVASILTPPAALTAIENRGESYLDPYQFGCDRYATKKRNVPDFVSNINKQDNNSTLTLGGVEFVSSATKKTPHDRLSNPQFMEGALRILRALITEDGVATDVVVDHINYLIQISIFAQSFPWTNVLQYDKVYREEQSLHGFRWGTSSPFLMSTHLQRPLPASFDARTKRNKQPHVDPKSRKPVCMKYNSALGCDLPVFRYAHVCKECFANHPEVEHSKTSKN